MQYRPFRNTDPPALVEVWNESLTSRGAFPLRTPAAFDRWILSKPYFTPGAMTVAVDPEQADRIVGFALSGFGPNDERTAQDTGGVVCGVFVRPSHRRRGIGRELFRRSEEWLRQNGADVVVVGPQRPYNPYLFGMYGGSNSPGILASEPIADDFLNAVGFEKGESHLVFQRPLDKPLDVADGRFVGLRRRFDIQMIRPTVSQSWWEECMWGVLEPTEFRVVDKMNGTPAGRLVNWELEGFGWKWNKAATGIFDVEIRAHLRRQGLAKFLLASVLKLLQEQFYAVAELQVWADDPAGIGICRSLGFEQVDVGYRYRAKAAQPAPE
jgi:ribosomal protein S18 acetylase RimI-like enzyme